MKQEGLCTKVMFWLFTMVLAPMPVSLDRQSHAKAAPQVALGNGSGPGLQRAPKRL